MSTTHEVFAMSDQQQKKPRRDPASIDDPKLRLYGKPINDTGRQTSLRIKMDANNNPIIEVDTGTKTEGRNGKEGYPIKMETPMSPIPFRKLMDLIERVANFKGGAVEFELDNWGKPWIYDKAAGKNVKATDPMQITRFQIAKREDGMVTFGCAAKNKPEIVFEFKDDEWHILTQKGQPVAVELSSQMAAVGWAGWWRDHFANYFDRAWVEPEFAKQRRLENMQRNQGNGRQGNGNQNYQQRPQQQQQQQQYSPPPQQQQQGGSNVPNDSFDDDIPF